jgi:hypothetical protein
MINAKSLAANTLYSSDDRKKQATTTRRLIGGLRAAAKSIDADLTETEKQTLSRAIALLSSMSDAYVKAAALRKAAEARQVERKALARRVVGTTFGALSDISDKVAVIAAATSYAIDTDLEEKLQGPRAIWYADYFLHRTFEDALDSIARSASWGTGQVETNAAEAWAKFEGAAKNLRLKHARTIQLVAEARRTPSPVTGGASA